MRATDIKKTKETPDPNTGQLLAHAEVEVEAPITGVIGETGVAIRSALPVTEVDKWAGYKEADTSDFDQQDMAIPRVKLVQSTSPCVIKSNPGYVKGVHNGDFLFTMDNTSADAEKGFLFIPCAYRREYTEWTPKRTPAAFHGTNDAIMRQCEPNEKGSQMLPNGNEVVMSGSWYGMASQDEGQTWGPVVIGLNKSQFKVSKKLASSIQMFRETDATGRLRQFPMFWRAFRVTSEQTSGELGAWNLWAFASEAKSIELGGEKLLEECVAFRESVNSGVAHARHEDEVE